MERLAGKVAIVTGASRGIGRACAIELAAEGVALVLGARDSERLDAVVGEIAGRGAAAVAVPGDVGDPTTFMLDKGRVMHADARQLRYPDERGDLVGTMQEKWY